MSGGIVSQPAGTMPPRWEAEAHDGEPAQVDTAAGVDRLLHHLESKYELLLQRLTSALRSRETAADVLHDAYLKLGAGASVGEVRNPLAYLFRMAMNLAKNRQRRDARLVPIDADLASRLADERPDPERAALSSHMMDRALVQLAALPDQRRAIFLARWRDEKPQGVIAAELGLHKRTVQKELARAEQHLRTALGIE